MTREQIQERLLAVVSERTGYPAEMLGLDADLEGDLGIDSIKRVEIAGHAHAGPRPGGSLRDRHRGAHRESDADGGDRHPRSRARRLWGDGDGGAAGEHAGAQRPFEEGPAEEERIGRFVVQAQSAPAITDSAGLDGAGAVVIVDDEQGVGAELERVLTSHGETVIRLARAEQPRDAEEASALVTRTQAGGGVKALVHLAALAEPQPDYGALPALLALAQALREQLEAAAARGGAVLLGATGLGGAFGVDGDAPLGTASQGAIHGFLKSAAQEWPTVRVKSVDLQAMPATEAAAHLLAELAAADGLVEVGYRDGERVQLGVVAAPLAERRFGHTLDAGSVLLVTGGARGITAHVALTLAERGHHTLVLVGRTPLEAEGEQTAGLSELAELRAAMIELRKREGRELKPALVEQDCRRILAAREVRENLERLRATGASVEYLVCDVSDSEAFSELIDSVYARHGRIDGVIHGAGVIEDSLIRDKQRPSLERVLATKAGAAQTLAERLRPEGLRFLVLFSSVSGRFGNRGQADYAAASEVLGKLAHELDRRWPARVVAVDWGPWRAAGMVSPWLEAEFARRGVALIGLDQGARMLEQELSRGRKGEAEIVIGAATGLAAVPDANGAQGAASTTAAEPERAGLALLAGAEEITRGPGSDAGGRSVQALYTFALARDRYLGDHRIDGRPVLPFAVAMELMAELAATAAPGRQVAGLRTIRLLGGLALEHDRPASVRIDAAAPDEDGEIEVTIRPVAEGRPHYRARAQFGELLGARELPGLHDPSKPGIAARPAPLPELAPFPLAVADAYRDLLFHGPLFQGIVAIDGMDGRGASALLRPSSPAQCVAGAEGRRWLLDPVLIDSALQMQVLWARLQWEVTLLPAEIGAYVKLGEPAAEEPVRHELRIRPASNLPLCHADHWFYGADGRLLALLHDVVGVGTQALNRLAGAKA